MVRVKRFLEGDIVALGTVGYDGFERSTYGFGLFNELQCNLRLGVKASIALAVGQTAFRRVGSDMQRIVTTLIGP
jgi:hypothetical protein